MNHGRRLFVMTDLSGYSLLPSPDRGPVVGRFTAALDEAAAAAGCPRDTWERQVGGDGELSVLPADIDDCQVATDLVLALDVALFRANQHLGRPPLRVRLALHYGVAVPIALGWGANAPVRVARLLASAALRASLAEPGPALAVAISDQLFEDLSARQPRGFRAADYHPVRVEIPEKGFRADAWIRGDEPAGGPAGGPGAARPASATTSARRRADPRRPALTTFHPKRRNTSAERVPGRVCFLA